LRAFLEIFAKNIYVTFDFEKYAKDHDDKFGGFLLISYHDLVGIAVGIALLSLTVLEIFYA
jgi:hypothetical protein